MNAGTPVFQRDVVRPILKWAGGKWRIAPKLARILGPQALEALWAPGGDARLVEPFAGSAALTCYVQPLRGLLADANTEIINLYSVCRDRLEALLGEIGQIAAEAESCLGEESFRRYYLDRRDEMNELISKAGDSTSEERTRRAALLLFLNRSCFNGLWRVNSRGEFNVPVGRPAANQPAAFLATTGPRLKRFSRLLQGIALLSGSYEDALKCVGSNDIVYLDPPYDAGDEGSFTSYTSQGFGWQDHQTLFLSVLKILETHPGIRVVVSNSDTERIRALYESRDAKEAGLRVHTIRAPRVIAAQGSRRNSISELVLTNIPPM